MRPPLTFKPAPRHKIPMPRLLRILSASLGSPSKLLDRVCNAALVLVLTAALWQHYFYGRHDPHNCRALLGDGVWPPADSNSHIYRDFEKWEPSGCRMTEFSRDEFRDCLGSRRVVFAGDSTIRQIYWAAATRLDHVKTGLAVLDVFTSGTKQQDLSFEAEGVKLKFIWDPWLNSSSLETELTRFRAQDTLMDVGAAKSKDEESAGLIIAGAPGLWSARHGGDNYFKIFKGGIDNIRPHLRSNLDDTMTIPNANLRKNYDAAPNQILLAPVQIPWYNSLSPGRAETITPERVDKMNNYLGTLSRDEKSHVAWVYNSMTQSLWKAFEETGIHVVDGVAERKIDIALNARCNAAGIGRKYPLKRTCCVAYPRETPIQPALLFMGIAGFPLLLWAHRHINLARRMLPSNDILRALRAILFAVVWCWITDRTQYFAKVERHYHQGIFLAGCTVFGLASLMSFRKSPQLATSTSSPSKTKEKSELLRNADLGFLSRDQSDEFKGWMQALILIYHYNYASQTLWIYKIVRLLVSTYIFLSAYGHTAHLLKTEDFSLRRVVSVIFRLNALSALLPYMMMTGYNFYYFAPVVTFWYLAVWLTLRVFKRYNQDPLLLFAKVIVSAIIASYFISIPAPLQGLSTVCRVLFRMPWDSGEVRFRLSLERYVVYLGVVTASIAHRIAFLRSRQVLPRSSQSSSTRTYTPSHLDPALAVIAFPDPLTKPLKPIACIFSFLFILFFFFVTRNGIEDKVQYNLAHPYISWVPIISIVIIRNSHRMLRNSYMALPAALGRISLETYILQYHIWLGSDATAILRIGVWDRYGSPFRRTWLAMPGRLIETILLTVAFICISAQTRDATEALTGWLFGATRQSHRAVSMETHSEEHACKEESAHFVLTPDKQDTESDIFWGGRRVEPTNPGTLQRIRLFVSESPGLKAAGLMLVLWVGNLVYG